MNQVSPLSFYRRAQQAIADPNLQTALDRATGRMVVARRRAIAAVADGEAARDHARRIRAHTIANLDRYLDQFIEQARAAGVHVHFAADAGTATRLVVDIARRHDVKRVVKGKSMVTEEIHLNDALESAGMRVVETDLGEYIVQLDRRRAVAHHRADHPQDEGAGRRAVPPRTARHATPRSPTSRR